MKKLLYIICICLIATSCYRRELTYEYSPYCEVVVNIDWSNMSTPPTGVSVRAYPESGDKPIVVESNTIDRAVLKLPAGIYNILVFNQIPSDYGTVSFRGVDKWETVEVYSNENTKVQWAQSRSERLIVREPEVVAAATYTDVEICEECIVKSTEHFKLTGERLIAHTINVKPRIVVKKTHIKVKVDGIGNLRSTTAVFTGMSNGYNFSTQKSLTEQVSHAIAEPAWKIKKFNFGERYGETDGYFISFGLPEITTSTRQISDNWRGKINLQMKLVDNKTVIEHIADVTQYTQIKSDEDSKADADFDVDVETSISVKIGLSGNSDDQMVVLPDVKPEGGSAGGFDATVDEWGDEKVHDVQI